MGLTVRIDTIDVWGVRALVDQKGHAEAASMVRCLAVSAGRETLPCIDVYKGQTNFSVNAYFRECSRHGRFVMNIDRDCAWRMVGDTLTFKPSASVSIPDTMLSGMVGHSITTLIGHPLLDDGMIVTDVGMDGGNWEIVLSGTSRPLEDVLHALTHEVRP